MSCYFRSTWPGQEKVGDCTVQASCTPLGLGDLGVLVVEAWEVAFGFTVGWQPLDTNNAQHQHKRINCLNLLPALVRISPHDHVVLFGAAELVKGDGYSI